MSHGSAVAGHACVNGGVRWLLGSTYHKTACMSALLCGMVAGTNSVQVCMHMLHF